MSNSIIFEVIESVTNNLGVKDGIDLLVQFIETMKFNPQQFIKSCENIIDDFCEEKQFCQECLEFAEQEDCSEKREYGDTEVIEEMCRMVCPECGKEF